VLPHLLLRDKFSAGLPYSQYVQTSPGHQSAWDRVHSRIQLSDQQRALAASFHRRINVLALSGMWCGDCAAQVPMLARIAEASTVIDLRIVDRDGHDDLAEHVLICGGRRVPTVLFLNEDFDFVSLLGDQTLTRLRAKAARALAACPLPGAPAPVDETAATLGEWLAEIERVHLLLRLSPKLRERYQD
jgi:thiol-disulfide isomerase/thioredoxin